MPKSYADLEAWQKAMDLAVECHKEAETFPRSELFGLVSQLRRSSSSVAANIAEGQGRLNRREFRQHAGIARGSLMETETHLILSHRLGYIDNSRWEELMARSAEVGRLLNGLLRWLDEDVTGSRMGH